MSDLQALKVQRLYQYCDPEQFDFETSADLEPLTDLVGQDRAVEAIRFAIGIKQEGYNLFALGPTGTGKRSFIAQFFEQKAAQESPPDDWCYVNNFDEASHPIAIRLPAGQGVKLRQDIEQLVEELRATLSAAFESEEYQTRRQVILEAFQEKQSQVFHKLRQEAEQKDLALLRTPTGLAFAPVQEGEVLSREELQELPEEEQKRIEEAIEALHDKLQEIVRQVPTWQREMQEKLKELNHEIADFAVGGLIEELCEKYADYAAITEHLQSVQKDVVENAQDFLPSDEDQSDLLQQLSGGAQAVQSAILRRYQVNVLVDRSALAGAPVVYEDNPTYQNLVGRVEHVAQMGALLTDFNLIKAGALHRANGGYLILDARKVLLQPYAWEGLKRALQSKQLRLESVGQMLSLVSTVSLEPEPIPLEVKVALYGEPLLYYMLWDLDPEFRELFKVQADFQEQMDRDTETQLVYARLIATLIEKEQLRPFDRAAVARVIERGSRLVGDREKLTTQMRYITDLLREAHYWAGQAGRDVVSSADVQRAIDAQIYRADRLRERSQEAILREIVLIDTEGERVGQVNGLSVIPLGNWAFGRPTRITAQVRLGKGQVMDIEREVDLGGPIHSKGVLILSAFLGGRYAKERPLSLSASLVFEQSYGGVEGDSASLAELYALLSAIAERPLRQSLAVTGSVNQHGQIQAIGGVNEKVEGFFDICQARGLTGDQGVLIPAANVQHLMLRQDVIEAVEAGQFHLYALETVDQGLELLTGLPAGERDEEGEYPAESFNGRVFARLAQLAEKRRSFSAAAEEKEV